MRCPRRFILSISGTLTVPARVNFRETEEPRTAQMKLWFVLLVLLFSSAAGFAQNVPQTVRLQKIPLPDTSHPAGMTNLFFAKVVNNQQVRYRPEGNQAAIYRVLR